jgi:phage terminase Nu1 subunit (DNA packaging protein)
MATDNGIHQQISELVAAEKRLREQLQAREIDPVEERAQLHEIEVQLDQCWDLLRQRDALRTSGGDPDSAAVRPASEVEGYLG